MLQIVSLPGSSVRPRKTLNHAQVPLPVLKIKRILKEYPLALRSDKKRRIEEERGELFRRALEHFILKLISKSIFLCPKIDVNWT